MGEKVKLTEYSHGAGCGCKISPAILDSILSTSISRPKDQQLLVGNSSRDDAAVYDMGDGTAVISTTDFFMPIVDDPFTFGKIAATNAISDVYAMGGSPLLAIAILGWPIGKLSPEVASDVIEGGRQACQEAGILLAGGHSIDSPEPIFGLAVTGRVSLGYLKRNDTAKEGDLLYLTKPLGVGVLSTAQKKKVLSTEHKDIASTYMTKLNKIGESLGRLSSVTAMTDVTGFGLLGHLREMCEGAHLSAEINYSNIPIIPEALDYIRRGAVPGGTSRNWDSYGEKVKLTDEAFRTILCDPQTSGGLLIAASPSGKDEVESTLKDAGLRYEPFGQMISRRPWVIMVA